MRYFLITYARKAGGQIDEIASVSRNLKKKDSQTCNVIMDYKEKKVIQCVIEGKKLDTDFDKLNEYYKKVYPNMIEKLEQIVNG